MRLAGQFQLSDPLPIRPGIPLALDLDVEVIWGQARVNIAGVIDANHIVLAMHLPEGVGDWGDYDDRPNRRRTFDLMAAEPPTHTANRRSRVDLQNLPSRRLLRAQFPRRRSP